MKVRFRRCLAAVFFFALSLDVSASAVNDFLYDLSEPLRFYQPARSPWSSNYYYDAQTACTVQMPPPNRTTPTYSNPVISYSNPRAEYRNGYGFGCTYDLTYTYPTITYSYPNTFYQNWVYVNLVCPSGSSLNSDKLCQLTKQPQIGTCDCIGNPVLPGRGSKTQIEVDYQGSTKQGDLFFRRQYSSWHFKSYSNTLGNNWFISVFGRYLTFDASPTFVAATRALGDTRGWDFSGGAWVERVPTGDRLENYMDGIGSAYRYYDAQSQAYEVYDANGALLRIEQ